MTGLELVSTEELIKEFSARFDSYVIHAVKRRTCEQDLFFFRWGGGQPACLGLVDLMHLKIMDIHTTEGKGGV